MSDTGLGQADFNLILDARLIVFAIRQRIGVDRPGGTYLGGQRNSVGLGHDLY